MRHFKIILCGLVASLIASISVAGAKLASQPELMARSKELRADAEKSKNPTTAQEKLRALEAELTKAKSAYRKKNPKEGTDAEDKVFLMDLALKPVFEAKNFDAKTCKKLNFSVEHDDLAGKPQDTPLTDNAIEALQWLKLLCPN